MVCTVSVPGDLAVRVRHLSGHDAIAAGVWTVLATADSDPMLRLYIATHPEHRNCGRLIWQRGAPGVEHVTLLTDARCNVQ